METTDHSSWCMRKDASMLLLRIAVGAAFIVHGSMKWGLWSAPPSQLSSGMLMLFKFLSIVEPIGGVAVILGFLTSWAAAGLSLIMLGAIYMKITKLGIPYTAPNTTGWEFDLTLLGGLAVLMTYGAGCWAVDALMHHRKEGPHVMAAKF